MITVEQHEPIRRCVSGTSLWAAHCQEVGVSRRPSPKTLHSDDVPTDRSADTPRSTIGFVQSEMEDCYMKIAFPGSNATPLRNSLSCCKPRVYRQWVEHPGLRGAVARTPGRRVLLPLEFSQVRMRRWLGCSAGDHGWGSAPSSRSS